MPEPSPIPPHARRAFLRRALAASSVGPIALGATLRAAAEDPRARARGRASSSTGYVRGFLPLYTAASEAAWAASTDVSEAHTADQIAEGPGAQRVRRGAPGDRGGPDAPGPARPASTT